MPVRATATTPRAGWAVLVVLAASLAKLAEGGRRLCDEAEAAHEQALARLEGG